METLKFPVSSVNKVVHKVKDTAINIANSFTRIKFITIRPHGGTFSALHQVYNNEDYLKRFKDLIHLTFHSFSYVGSIEKNKDIGYHCHLMVDISTGKLNNLKILNLDKFDVLNKWNLKQHCWMISKPNENIVRGAIYFMGFNIINDGNIIKKSSYHQTITNVKDRIFQPVHQDIRDYVDLLTDLKSEVVNAPKEHKKLNSNSYFKNVRSTNNSVIQDLGEKII